MSYTFTEHKTDGVTTTFPFQFAGKDKAYLRATDISVYLKVGSQWQEVMSGWALSGTNQLTFITPPAASPTINLRIRRIVPKEVPFAEFDRGVTLDMRSLNSAFIQNLQVTQELMDGFFPVGFFYKEDLNMGGNHIVELAPGVNTGDAANFGQVKAVDDKHTAWNLEQDLILEGLKAAAGAGTAHNTVPWVYTAVGGEVSIKPPYSFTSALVWLNGILQYELLQAIVIEDSSIKFAEPLDEGMEVLVLIGSRMAAPEDGEGEINISITEGQTSVNLGVTFSSVRVELDGLGQPSSAYSIVGQTLVFSEPLPACNLTAYVVIPASGGEAP